MRFSLFHFLISIFCCCADWTGDVVHEMHDHAVGRRRTARRGRIVDVFGALLEDVHEHLFDAARFVRFFFERVHNVHVISGEREFIETARA